MVGIDIGSNSVKVVELVRRGGQRELENIGEAMLPDGAVTGKSISDGDVVAGTILGLVSRLGLRTKDAAIGLCGEVVSSGIVSVPGKSLGRGMEKRIPKLLDLDLPGGDKGVNCSYARLSGSNGHPEEVPVLIAAVSKKTAREYRSSVSSAGLRASVIDIDSMALSNSYALFREDAETTALVNIGAAVTNLSVVRDGIPFMMTDIALGGRLLTLELIEKLKITYEEAERIKYNSRDYGRHERVVSVFDGFVARAATGIKTALEGCEEDISRAVLSGGCSRIASMADALGEALGVPVEISDPFRNITVSDSRFEPEYVKHLAPKMAVAVGLALRGL